MKPSKPKVGVSSCLLGEKVRWNGEDKRNAFLVEELKNYFEFVPVCPEVEVGMGVPREPVQLAGSSGKMIGVVSGRDWTGAMKVFSEQKIAELLALGLCGFIFKSRSPSCGTGGIPIYDNKREEQPEQTAGLFAKAFMQHAPSIPFIEEEDLQNKKMREDFIANVHTSRRNSGVSE